MNETLVLGNIMILIATYLECASKKLSLFFNKKKIQNRIFIFFTKENAHYFHELCIESLEFISCFLHITELNFTRTVLQSLYKLTLFVNKNIVMSYPLLVDRLLDAGKLLANMQQKETHDSAAKYIISEILRNINKLFTIPTGLE
jgi:hypothetical protein